VRAPTATSIGADLLVGASASCDVPMLFRLLNTSSFSADWLTSTGSKGETPLMAATRAACGEAVALITLQPGFDGSTIGSMKKRRILADHAIKYWQGRESEVQWALAVLLGVRNGKVSQQELEWDPKMVSKDFVWFLPKPGEWFPPKTLNEMGIVLPMRPPLPQEKLASLEAKPDSNVPTRLEDVIRLWYLLVAHVQTPVGTEAHESTIRHIRSIGWSLFFFGGKPAMMRHSMCVDFLSYYLEDVPDANDIVHQHLHDYGEDMGVHYQNFSQTLGIIWNKTGDWVFVDV